MGRDGARLRERIEYKQVRLFFFFFLEAAWVLKEPEELLKLLLRS